MIAVSCWNELPKTCEECPIWDDEQCFCRILFYEGLEEKECPLIKI
jgi:hypothetical protein